MSNHFTCKRYHYYDLCPIYMHVGLEFDICTVLIIESAHADIP